ncbi:DUF4132 domain-containing protein [Streptomyces sp. NPDC002156]
MSWLTAGDGYEVALVRDHPEVQRLRRLAEWLQRHTAACLAQVDAWISSSLPVPTELVARVWPDEVWRSALRDLVVVGDAPDEVGFLRDATESGELRVVNLDGETVRLSPRTVTLPHPVLLPDLEELREFATGQGIVQRVEQIHRAVWRKPANLYGDGTEVTDFAGASFGSPYALAASLGYRTTGGYTICRMRDGQRTVDACLWTGSYEYSTQSGALFWGDRDGRALRLREIGPVAWSEGTRIAAALHAGRVIEEGTDA